MKVCPYCRQDLPDDTVFCSHCGKPLEEVKKEPQKTIKKERRAKQQNNKQSEPTQKNIWTTLGIILFLLALIGFDGIIATIFNALNMDYKIIFGISLVLYACAISCGIVALIKDLQLKKQEKQTSGNYPMAIAEIVISSYIILVNLQQILIG